MTVYKPPPRTRKYQPRAKLEMEYPPRMSDEEFDAFLRSLYTKYGGRVPDRLKERDPVKKAYGPSGLMEL